MKSMALKSSQEVRLVKWFCLAGAGCQLLVAKTASTVWGNVILKRCDAILAKVKDSISFEPFMDLRNSKLSGSTELLPAEAVEKSSCVPHDEVIRKAVSVEKPAHKTAKNLIFHSIPGSNSRLSARR